MCLHVDEWEMCDVISIVVLVLLIKIFLVDYNLFKVCLSNVLYIILAGACELINAFR